MARFDRITFDPKVMGGRACIRGMRIPSEALELGAIVTVEDARHRVRRLPP